MEDNKLIAEFMGANPFRESVNEDVLSYEMYGLIESIEDGVYEKHFFLPSEMKFHKSGSWLKPVVDKIEDYLSDNVGKVGYFDECLSSNNLDVRYQAVVEFIKTYNDGRM